MGYVHSVLGAHMAKYGTIITPLRLAINILLRLVIVYIAGGSLLIFYFLIWFYDFVRPTIDLFTLLGGVLAPAFALVAIVLAVANKYLLLAALFAVISRFGFTMACC
jgi:hypothetical protein